MYQTGKHLDTMQAPLILAIETSGRLGSVAVARGDDLLTEMPFSSPMKHSAELFPAMAALLRQISASPADVAEVYVSAGPGSFTGIRLAVTVAKTMALANGTRIVAVNSLEAAAQNATNYASDTEEAFDCVAVVLDAKRGQFFAGFFRPAESGGWRSSGQPQLIRPDAFLTQARQQGKQVYLLGEGLQYYASRFAAPWVTIVPEAYWQPKASAVHFLGRWGARANEYADPLSLVPEYVRRALDEDSPARKRPL